MSPVESDPASGRRPSSDLRTDEVTAMEEEGFCSVGGGDVLMADGELRRCGVAGKQGSLPCFADGLHAPGACSGDYLNGVVNVGCMAQGKALGIQVLHGVSSVEVCMDSGILQGDKLILDAGCAHGVMHGGRNSALVKADGLSSSAGVCGESPHLFHEEAVNGSKAIVHEDKVHVFSAMRHACNESNINGLPAAGHFFKVGSRSSSYARQKLFSSKPSGVCTPGVYSFA